ncbi:MAG: NUDIX hydrolase [Candidatus Kerfeldbacteria bacterium]|nr:NUDIX hydrolase [Candidatus Kerfeldbacteria bacterium]
MVLKVQKKPFPSWYIWARPAANVIPVTDDGRILLMHEYKSGTKRWIGGFPGGIIERGETAAQAARRECEEELGLRPSRLRKLTEVKTDFPDTLVTYFLGFGLKKVQAKHWASEKIGNVKKVTVKHLERLARNGKIQDPRMVVAILSLTRKKKIGKVNL